MIAGYHVVRKNKKVLKQEANVTLEKIDYLKKSFEGKIWLGAMGKSI